MKSITVSTSKEYRVLVGEDLISRIYDHISQIVKSKKVAVISDSNVWPLYGYIVESSFRENGVDCCHYVFPAGEDSKNGQTYLDILNFLAENNLTRKDALIALGGGVVGDLTGFVAATYMRGIAYVQVPTSLLAMVDSSVGGKTAIDLPAGKNLAGAFYQPSLVLCDIQALTTLPQQNYIDGCAEVIKYGVLYDEALFDHLADSGLDFGREYVITRCIELKRDVVCSDEFDNGLRQKLNLGHTIGHAVERISNFGLTHGQAVAIGTCIVTKAAANMGLCDRKVYDQIHGVIKQFMLPAQTQYTAGDIYQFALTDKKRSGNTIQLIVPKAIGDCIIYPLPISELKSFIKAGL